MAEERAESAWDRIRRARLVQILGVYVGISFGVLQAVDIFANRLPIPEWTFVAALVLFVIGLPVVLATAYLQSIPRPGRGWLTWGRTLGGGALSLASLVFVVVAVTVLGVLGMGPAGSLIARGVIDSSERVLIADFRSQTGDVELAAALTEAFRVDFEQSPLLTVVPQTFVRDALRRMARPPATVLDEVSARELAEREGIKALIAGEVNSAGRSFVVTVRLISAADGAVLTSQRETAGDSAALIGAIDRLSKSLRRRIGESLVSLRANDPLEQVSTPSILALRSYSQATRAADIERDHDKAIALLEEAIRQDSTFAMAYRKLGVVLLNQGSDAQRAHAALAAAYEHRDRLTERERYLTLGTYYSYVEHEPERAIAAYRTLLDTHPNETGALNNLAILYSLRREHALAEELYRRAITFDSTVAVRYTNLASQLVAQGKFDATDSVLSVYRVRFGAHAQERLTAAALAYNRGDLRAARALYEEIAEDRSSPAGPRSTALSAIGQLEVLSGRPAAAMAVLSRAHALAPQDRGIQQRYEFALGQALLELTLLGDAVAARARVESVLAQSPLAALPDRARPYPQLTYFFATLGDGARARAYFEALAAPLSAAERERQRADLEWVEGLVLRAEGELEEALRLIRRVSLTSACEICPLPELARTYQLLGMPDSAAAAYERYLGTPWLSRLNQDASELPRVLLALGELYDSRGDASSAIRHYARLLDLWSDAEPLLRPRLDHLRRTIQRLTSETGVAAADPAG
jgi:eukaryotic-like serine/threonine-protein kinase